MLEVVKPGLETSIQDYPGRIGYLNLGFPWSSAMDSWSLRLANVLVGNNVGDAGLECQYIGPFLKAQRDTTIAITGADMQAKVDGVGIPMWESVALKAGQTLEMTFAKTGTRSYVAIAGGIKSPEFLGARATFHKAGVGGIGGHAIQEGQVIPVGTGNGNPGRKVKESARPQIATDKQWQIEVVCGPNDDWIDKAGHERFLSTKWKLSAKSDRSGFRLEGPDWTFTEKAYNKLPEHGSDPANIIDQGYPVGGINLAGQTPIILVNDGPSMGGFINPYTVPQCAFWKLGQAKPSELLLFEVISVEEAQQKARDITALCSENSIV
ncbi:MAG TPA: aminopeptidase [Gammaproteobacteria bacterium]|nr:aminopeptidase [Gammaproteobacteria bacterium]|tara:strand:+ start:3755 stop:4723 length:969 start_codon:yes stop_codon:yes gene_type:complete